MKKKIMIAIVLIVVAALLFAGGQLAGAFPWQYLSKDKVEAFIEDSHYTFTYALPDGQAKDEYDSILTNELATQMSVVTYAARQGFSVDTDGDAYIVSAEDLENEKSSLFLDVADGSVEDSKLLTFSESTYLLHLKDAEDTDLSYEIVDAFYGLIGSESTSITVLYRLNGEECKLTYVLASDKDSPYSFQVVDIIM